MKFSKTSISATIIALTIGTAQATPEPAATQNLDSSTPVFLVQIKTKVNHYFDSYIEQYYGGVSTIDPCSDLHLLHSYSYYNLSDHTYNYDTSGIVHDFGERLTCIKTDIIWNDKTYSSGNIQLMWDESAISYVTATPGKVTIDLDNPATSR